MNRPGRQRNQRAAGRGSPSRCCVLWIVLVASLIGCATPPLDGSFLRTGPGWHVRQGQAIWTVERNGPALAGELLVATSTNGSFFVQFSKTPLTLVEAGSDGRRWRIEFPGEQRVVAGRGEPPKRFLWFHLPSALTGQSPPEPIAFQQRAEGGWRLENVRSGEVLEGYLSP